MMEDVWFLVDGSNWALFGSPIYKGDIELKEMKDQRMEKIEPLVPNHKSLS